MSAKQKTAARIVFSVYMLLLIWLVLFKFAVSFSELPSIRGINLIPFYYDRETSSHLKEVLYNIIVFVPLGVYVQILGEGWKARAKFFAAFLVSLLFEVIQFIFAIGASDITDIIGNTLGAVVGIMLCVGMRKLMPRRYISVINITGALIEAAGVGLMALLFLAN